MSVVFKDSTTLVDAVGYFTLGCSLVGVDMVPYLHSPDEQTEPSAVVACDGEDDVLLACLKRYKCTNSQAVTLVEYLQQACYARDDVRLFQCVLLPSMFMF